MPRFLHQGFDFHYIDRGAGIPFVFQHGLGGSTDQAADLFPPLETTRFISPWIAATTAALNHRALAASLDSPSLRGMFRPC